MNCPRELETLDAISTALWPDELQQHAASCALCADLVAVATAFREDMREAVQYAPVPSSGLMWWRVQRRERQEAARTAERTITFVQTASVLGAIAVALTIIGGLSVMNETWRGWIARLWSSVHFETIAAAPQWTLPLMIAIAACVVLAPVAVYFAFAEE